MKTTTPSCSALAQNGWNLGSLSSTPLTLPPIPAPRRRGGHQVASHERELGERAAGSLEELTARGRHGWPPVEVQVWRSPTADDRASSSARQDAGETTGRTTNFEKPTAMKRSRSFR